MFLVYSNSRGSSVHQGSFGDIKAARKFLESKYNEIRHRPGVYDINYDGMKFSFLIGWEEIEVIWYIEEIKNVK